MPHELFMPAPNRLSQLAQNAIDEEQYDLAITCCFQTAQHGRKPSSDLLRSLVAISLCSLPRTSGTKKGSALSRPTSRKKLERMAPTATMVLDARRLLEKLGKQGLNDAIFDAILPILSNKAEDKDKSKNKRSRASYEGVSSDEDDEDEYDFASSPIGDFCRRMVECHNIWQIMALGDMMDKPASSTKRRVSGGRRNGASEGREGEDSIRSNDVFDREGVWGLLEVFLQCWKNEAGKRQTTSHFAEQFVESPQRNREPRSKRAPSTYVGEAFEVIYAGLCPNSLVQPDSEDPKSAKCREKERHRRKDVATSLLKQIFELVKARLLDKQAVLRATANLLQKIDSQAMTSLSFAIAYTHRSEWVEIALLGLGTKQEKAQEGFPLEEYQECLKELGTIKKLPKATIAFLKEIDDGTWLTTAPADEHELALAEFFDGHHSKKEVASLGKNTAIKALLADKWRIDSHGKGSSKGAASKLTWEQLSFAAAWRRATIQAMCKNIELKLQILYAICHLKDDVKGIPTSVQAWERVREIIIAAMKEPAAQHLKMVKDCCAEMGNSYEQMKADHATSSNGNTNGNGKNKNRGRGFEEDSDDDEDDDEMHSDDDQEREVDWKKEMRKQLDACTKLSEELAGKVRLIEFHSEAKKKRKSPSKPKT